MRNGSIVTVCMTGIMMVAACLPASNEQTTNNGNTASNGNAAVVAVGNGSGVTVDANVATFTSGDRSNASPSGLNANGPKKSGGTTADALEIARKNAQPAPDNSTFFSFLSDAGYEIRTFNNHPQILKVEKKTTNEGKTTAKIFLRGGKVVEIDGNRFQPLSTAPANLILSLAGVEPKQPSAPAGVPAEKKPKE
jgi:hypothetical protein